MRSKLVLILIFLSLVMLSLADHSSESSDDDHSSKEDHSGDDPDDKKTEADSGTEKKGKEDSGKNKEKEKNKKEDKNKDKHEEANYDDDEDSQLSIYDIDKAFVETETTKKPGEVDNSEKTTVEPLGGLFTPGPSKFWEELYGSGGKSDGKSDSSSTAETTETPKDDSENDNGGSPQGHEGSHGTVSGNPFFPYPRPVDIWDRLIVLAAFPICFFALMLKAEMFR